MSVHESVQMTQKSCLDDYAVKEDTSVQGIGYSTFSKLQASLWPWTQQSMVAGLLKTDPKKKAGKLRQCDVK